jgi:hypothetical protein
MDSCAYEIDFVKCEDRVVQIDIDICLDKLNSKTPKKMKRSNLPNIAN